MPYKTQRIIQKTKSFLTKITGNIIATKINTDVFTMLTPIAIMKYWQVFTEVGMFFELSQCMDSFL